MTHTTIGIVVPYVKHRRGGDWENSIRSKFLEFQCFTYFIFQSASELRNMVGENLMTGQQGYKAINMLDKNKYKSCDYHCVIWYSSRRRIRLELKQSVKGNILTMLDTFPPFEMSRHNNIFNSALPMRKLISGKKTMLRSTEISQGPRANQGIIQHLQQNLKNQEV